MGTDQRSWEPDKVRGAETSEGTSLHKETRVFMDCQIVITISIVEMHLLKIHELEFEFYYRYVFVFYYRYGLVFKCRSVFSSYLSQIIMS